MIRHQTPTERLKERVSHSNRDYNLSLRHELRELRQLCTDPSHVAATLSLIDATRRWREATDEKMCPLSSRGELLWWARKAAIKSAELLQESSVGRSPLHHVRGELSREYLKRSICGLLNEIGDVRRPAVPLPRSWDYV